MPDDKLKTVESQPKPGMWKPPPWRASPPRPAPKPAVKALPAAPVKPPVKAKNGTAAIQPKPPARSKYPPPPEGAEWSSYQKAIFDDVRDGSGHTVLKAFAGSAKTSTLVAALSLVPAKENVFFSAFNKRIVAAIRPKVGWSVDVNTLHSYGFRAIKARYGDEVKPSNRHLRNLLLNRYSKDKLFTYDLCEELESTISLAKNTMASTYGDIDMLIDDFSITVDPRMQRGRFIEMALDTLETCRTNVGTEIDFDDMIWLPVINNLELDQFDRVFVDELQDLNAAQIALVMRAVTQSGRFTAVGDPHQAIYMWRGAVEGVMGLVQSRFKAKSFPLPICYRCPQSVVELAQELVPGIEYAPNAPFGIVGQIGYGRMYEVAEPGDFILSRINAPLLHHALRIIAASRKAVVVGRDIGRTLSMFVRRSKETTIIGLLEYAAKWLETERHRLILESIPPRKYAYELAIDKVTCIRVLASHASSVQDLLALIDSIFGEAEDPNAVILSTVHKAKGLESKRVFVLMDTFKSRREYWERFARSESWLQERLREYATVEEQNVYYVAITRSQSELYLVKPEKPGAGFVDYE